MRNIKLTTTAGRKVLVNWDNVNFAKQTKSHLGNKYTEIHCGDESFDVSETLEEIEQGLMKPNEKFNAWLRGDEGDA